MRRVRSYSRAAPLDSGSELMHHPQACENADHTSYHPHDKPTHFACADDSQRARPVPRFAVRISFSVAIHRRVHSQALAHIFEDRQSICVQPGLRFQNASKSDAKFPSAWRLSFRLEKALFLQPLGSYSAHPLLYNCKIECTIHDRQLHRPFYLLTFFAPKLVPSVRG